VDAALANEVAVDKAAADEAAMNEAPGREPPVGEAAADELLAEPASNMANNTAVRAIHCMSLPPGPGPPRFGHCRMTNDE
jgi:hypothetical protein